MEFDADHISRALKVSFSSFSRQINFPHIIFFVVNFFFTFFLPFFLQVQGTEDAEKPDADERGESPAHESDEGLLESDEGILERRFSTDMELEKSTDDDLSADLLAELMVPVATDRFVLEGSNKSVGSRTVFWGDASVLVFL